jgi:hypothetical protein
MYGNFDLIPARKNTESIPGNVIALNVRKFNGDFIIHLERPGFRGKITNNLWKTILNNVK